jgi:hypothetical protein
MGNLNQTTNAFKTFKKEGFTTSDHLRLSFEALSQEKDILTRLYNICAEEMNISDDLGL